MKYVSSISLNINDMHDDIHTNRVRY